MQTTFNEAYDAAINIKIRKASVSDAPVIANFNSSLALETERKRLEATTIRSGVKALLKDPAKGMYFLAEVDGQIVGQTLITCEWSDWRNGIFWWIQSVYVDERFRGKGIFRALFDYIHNLAKKRRDVCGLRLYMDAENDRARRAYESLGLKRTNYELFEMELTKRNG